MIMAGYRRMIGPGRRYPCSEGVGSLPKLLGTANHHPIPSLHLLCRALSRAQATTRHEPRLGRFVTVLGDRTVADTGDQFIDGAQRHQKPLSGLNRLAEAIPGRQIKPRGAKRAVDEVFKLGAMDVVEAVLGDNFDVGQQEGRIVARVRDPA